MCDNNQGLGIRKDMIVTVFILALYVSLSGKLDWELNWVVWEFIFTTAKLNFLVQ